MANLIYFAPVSFYSYWQRPHFMVKAMLGRQYDQILWVEPPVTRLPNLKDFSYFKKKSSDRVNYESPSNIHVLPVRSLPIEPLPIIRQLNSLVVWKKTLEQLRTFAALDEIDIGIGRPSQLALWGLKNLKSRKKFIDVMDDYPAFYSGISRRSMQRSLNDVVSHCDPIFCSDDSLAEKLSGLADKQKIQIVPNAYDMSKLPAYQGRTSKKMIGFVGTIAAWFDWDLVLEIAMSLPDVPVRLVGPCIGDVPGSLPGNIEMKPACNLEQAIQYCNEFTVGLIPFKKNDLTDSVDPIKYYELKALGVNIWSTAFGSMTSRLVERGVFEIRPGSDWRGLWEQAQQGHCAEDEIMQFRKEHDWSDRFEKMMRFL